MTLASAVDNAAWLDRLLDGLSDPKRSGRTVAITLLLYCAVWTLYAVLSKLTQDIHFDMGEMVSWSREVTLGTPKHPPLPAWLVGIWFAVLPLQDMGLLSAFHGDGDARLMGRLDDLRALSRRRKARRRAGASHARSVLQFSRAEIQRQFDVDADMGADHVVLPALAR